MADITYADKVAGSTFSHEDANEIKTAVNTKVDKETGKVLSDNNYTDAEQSKLAGIEAGAQVNAANTVIDASYVHTDNNFTTAKDNALTSATVPTPTALTGEILLDRVNGRQYNTYDMASGALTFSIGASPTLFGCASGIVVSDATTTPVVSAFSGVFGTYDNTNDVANHWFAIYKYNASNALVAYLTWSQTT